jgi:hypothetical protein
MAKTEVKVMKIAKQVLKPERLRQIEGSFSFIPHSFLLKGFFASLSPAELLVYFLLVLVGDRQGLSYYSQDKLCSLLKMSLDDFITARNELIKKDLLSFNGFMFQVLSLPEKPVVKVTQALESMADFVEHDPFTIRQLIGRELTESEPGVQVGGCDGHR